MSKSDIDTPHSKYLHMFAAIRCEIPGDLERPQNSTSVVKIFSTKEMAQEEAERLRILNMEKSCLYEVQSTRFVE